MDWLLLYHLTDERLENKIYLARSHDRGITWNSTEVADGEIGKMALDGNDVVILGGEYSSLFFLRYDLATGTVGAPVKLDGEGFYDAELFLRRGQLYVVTHTGDSLLFYRSVDDGKNWIGPITLCPAGGRVCPKGFFAVGDTLHLVAVVGHHISDPDQQIRTLHLTGEAMGTRWTQEIVQLEGLEDGATPAAFRCVTRDGGVQLAIVTEKGKVDPPLEPHEAIWLSTWSENEKRWSRCRKVVPDFSCDHISGLEISFDLAGDEGILAFGTGELAHLFVSEDGGAHWSEDRGSTVGLSGETDYVLARLGPEPQTVRFAVGTHLVLPKLARDPHDCLYRLLFMLREPSANPHER